jgi:hypothetical protein
MGVNRAKCGRAVEPDRPRAEHTRTTQPSILRHFLVTNEGLLTQGGPPSAKLTTCPGSDVCGKFAQRTSIGLESID